MTIADFSEFSRKNINLPAVLIVDDLEINRKILRHMLEKMNESMEIFEAVSGIEALEYVKIRHFAMILMDIQMPELDGFETAKIILSNPKTESIPIVFITAIYNEEAHLIFGYETGAVDYLEKPVEMQILQAKVKVFLKLEKQRIYMEELNQKLQQKNDRLNEEINMRIEAQIEVNKLARAIEQSPSGVVIAPRDLCIEFANPRFVDMIGISPDKIKGRQLFSLLAEQSPEQNIKHLKEAQEQEMQWRGDLLLKREDGNLVWVHAIFSPVIDSAGTSFHYLALFEDISQRKKYEEQLLQQANFDDVTKLPNRILALDRLTQSMAAAKRSKNFLIVQYLDINNFRRINESLGMEKGDQLLSEVGRRLGSVVRSGDTAARLGGDEFLLILQGSRESRGADVIAEKIISSLSEPYMIDGREIVITVSIGISYASWDSDEPAVLIQNAEAAMYQARAAGQNNYSYFSAAMNVEANRRLTLEENLRHALKKGELQVVFQPRLNKGRLIGAEALLRWTGEKVGMVHPSEFIPVAEATGIIHEIGSWVMEEAVRCMKEWNEKSEQQLKVSVNVSALQFQRSGFLEIARKITSDRNYIKGSLEIEITESILMHGGKEHLEILTEISARGIEIAIDDFGTGYSSLSYIKRFPIDILKIDRAFIQDIETNPEDKALVRSIIAMGHALDMRVVAEGVESRGVAEFLLHENCDEIQGFYYSWPLAHEDFLDYIKKSTKNQ